MYSAHVSSNEIVLSESFFPFGKGAGDILVNITTPNGHSGPISLDSPLPFFGGVEDGPLYVCSIHIMNHEHFRITRVSNQRPTYTLL